MTTLDGYNGWKNRETWALMLNVNNDEGLLEQALEVVTDSFGDLDDYLDDLTNLDTDDLRMAKICLAREAFQEWAESWLTVDGYQQQFGDDMPVAIVRMLEDIGSLYRVDWYECAESLLEELLTEFDAKYAVKS